MKGLPVNQIRRFLFLAILVACHSPSAGQAQAPGVMIFDDDVLLQKITTNGRELLDAGQLTKLTDLVQQLSRPSCSLSLAPVRTTRLSATEVFEKSKAGTLSIGMLARDEASGEWFFNAATAFVLTEDGAVATSYHVLQHDEETEMPRQAPEVERSDVKAEEPVKTPVLTNAYLIAADFDGNVFPVKEVLAADKVSDVCILRIDAQGLTPLPLNPNTRPGETVYCFSNPSDMFGHFSQGIISRFFMNREPHEPPQKPNRPVCFLSVSTDFAVGSSGGPILDDRGNVVGQVQSTSSIFADAEEEHPQHPQMVVKAALAAREILALIKHTESEVTTANTPATDSIVQASSKSILSTQEPPDDLPPAENFANDTPANSEAAPTSSANDTASQSRLTRIALQFKLIEQDYETHANRLLPEVDVATTDDEIAALNARADQLLTLTETRCYRMANSYLHDPAVLPVLQYLIQHSPMHRERAFGLLVRNHVRSPDIGKTCVYLRGNLRLSNAELSIDQLEKLTRAVIAVNSHRESVGLATLVLAEILSRQARNDDPGRSAETVRKLRRESQTLFLRVKRQFGDLQVPSVTGALGTGVSRIGETDNASSHAESGLRQLQQDSKRHFEDRLRRQFAPYRASR